MTIPIRKSIKPKKENTASILLWNFTIFKLQYFLENEFRIQINSKIHKWTIFKSAYNCLASILSLTFENNHFKSE